MPSLLTPDPSAASAQSLVLHGRTLDVVRAVTREEAVRLKEEGERAREKADKRNMYLLREGGMHSLSCYDQQMRMSDLSSSHPAEHSCGGDYPTSGARETHELV